MKLPGVILIAAVTFSAGVLIGRSFSTKSVPLEVSLKPGTFLTIDQLKTALASARIDDDDDIELEKIVPTINTNQVREALAVAEVAKDRDVRSGVVKSLVLIWAQSDPRSALKYAQGLRSLAFKKDLALQVFQMWLDRDLPAANAWLKTEPPSQLQVDALAEYVQKNGESDPQAGLAVTKNFTDTQQRQLSAGSIFRQWVKRSPLEAAAAVMQMPAGPTAAMTGVLNAIVEKISPRGRLCCMVRV